MKKQQKIVTGINDKAIREAKLEVGKYILLLGTVKDSLNQLTEGKVSDFDMELVDAHFNGLTGFKNGLMSATAFNLQSEYNELKTLIDKVNQNTHLLQFITKGGVNEAKIEEEFTSYLREKYTKECLRIKEAVDILNESSTYVLQRSLTFGRSEVYFNVSAFESAKVMGGR